MGNLLNDIKDLEASHGRKPRILEILNDLSESDKADLLAALDDHSIPASNITKAMAKRGYKLAINVISRYRRGELMTEIK